MSLARPVASRRGLLVSALLAVSLAPLGCVSRQASARTDGPAVRTVTSMEKPKWGLVIHGGAGVIRRETLSPQREAEVRAKLEESLRAGHAVLARGGSSVDAVVAAIVVLEDSPLFNAGKGAVFTHEGRNELDASLMNGATREAGAVAGVTRVKNPILLARRVMEHSPHVMMVSQGAEAFAQVQGLELVPESYFRTEERWQQLQRALEKEAQGPVPSASADPLSGDYKFGTVGAVALDQAGRLAAGTSTGGMTNKRFGRVGDSPIIGAGTYADSRCAVSATGHGEFFIRYTVARDICARVEYLGVSLERAADSVIHDVLAPAGGEGGVIAMDSQGNVAMPFNSPGMYRGQVGAEGAPSVFIFKE